MFANEWFPLANAMGVSWEEFWRTNPYILKLIYKGYQAKIEEQDDFSWWSNQYTLSAASVAIEHNFAGKKARSKYLEKPLLKIKKEKEYHKKNDRPEYDGMTDEEKQKAELKRAKSYFNSLMKRF